MILIGFLYNVYSTLVEGIQAWIGHATETFLHIYELFILHIHELSIVQWFRERWNIEEREEGSEMTVPRTMNSLLTREHGKLGFALNA